MTKAKLEHYLKCLRQECEFPTTPQIKHDISGAVSQVKTSTVNIYYVNGRAHGPVTTFFGTVMYMWNGTRIPERFWVSPESVTLEDVFSQKNAETRRACLSIFGLDKVEASPQATILHEDNKTGAKMFEFQLMDNLEPIRFVKVINSTPEPDGTEKVYYLCIPADEKIKTCRDAIAWTFGKEAKGYNPVVET